MEDVSRIEARLESLEELSELVVALRSMAASRAREANEASEGTRSYCAIVDRAIREVLPLAAAHDRPFARPEGADAVLIVITSENGFVGGFNNRLVERALEVWRPEERLIVVGRRGQIAASEKEVQPAAGFNMTSRREGVTALARRIGAVVSEAMAARLVFARPERGVGYEIELRQVLPLDLPYEGRAAPLDAPLHHLPPMELIEGLAAEYLFAEIADALMASLSAENAARLRTMDAASRNIDERLEKLTREARNARQEQTTSDMLDVVTGAEAVNHR